MKGLSLAKFKKIREDKDWATLIHEDGHTLNIAKAPLSHMQRKQLENLAMHKYAEGGKVEHDDQGTGDAGNTIDYEKLIPQEQADKAPYGTVPAAVPDDQRAPAGVVTSAPDQAPPPAQAPSEPAPTLNEIQNKGLVQEQQAQQEIANTQAQLGKQQAESYEIAQAQLQNQPTQAEIAAKYNQAGQAIAEKYASQKLDPSKYWSGDENGNNGHSKIAAGIGILLSGLGQGLGMGRVQNNAALDAINKGIDDEINRQKNSQEQTHNLWKMNREALGSELAADLASKNQFLIGTQYDISKIAAQNKGPIAQAEANLAKAKFQQQIDANNFKLALMHPSSDGGDPASKVQFLVPEPRQAAVTKEISEAQNTVQNSAGILAAFQQAAKDSRPVTGGVNTSSSAFIPGYKTPGQQAFIGRIGPTVQEQEGSAKDSRFKSIEETMMPQFGDSDARIATKKATLLDYIRSKSAAPNAKSYGIDLQKYPSTNTLNIGNEPEIKVVNGVKYMRGPQGQAIQVK